MTLANKLRQKLNDSPAANERHDIAVTDDASGWSVYLTADRHDAWTTVAWEIAVRRAPVNGDVAQWAQRITQETSGLVEKLNVVEVDAPGNKALIRSATPSPRDGKVFYYELTLQGTSSALMRRFEGSHDSGKRQQIAFALTNEVLTKWIDDVIAE